MSPDNYGFSCLKGKLHEGSHLQAGTTATPFQQARDTLGECRGVLCLHLSWFRFQRKQPNSCEEKHWPYHSYWHLESTRFLINVSDPQQTLEGS